MNEQQEALPEPMTLDFIAARTAADLRKVAIYLEEAAQAVGQGDLGAAERTIVGCVQGTGLPGWSETLTVRFCALMEVWHAGRQAGSGK